MSGVAQSTGIAAEGLQYAMQLASLRLIPVIRTSQAVQPPSTLLQQTRGRDCYH